MQYREEGFLPQALLNYLVRLGWSHGDQEIFSREEMVSLFRIEDVNHSASGFDVEKLSWINQQYFKQSDMALIATELEWHLHRSDENTSELQSLMSISNAACIS